MTLPEMQTLVSSYLSSKLNEYAVKEGQKAVAKLHEGEGKAGKRKAKSGDSVTPLHNRAGLTFSVDPVDKEFKSRTKASAKDCVAQDAVVYLTAVLEYLCAEICELTGNCARDISDSTVKYSSKSGGDLSTNAYDEGEGSEDGSMDGEEHFEILLAEAHHVLKAVADDEELATLLPDLGARISSESWRPFLKPTALRDADDMKEDGDDKKEDDYYYESPEDEEPEPPPPRTKKMRRN